MSPQQWRDIYRKAWDAYYTPAHVATVIRRSITWGFNPKHMMIKLLSFYACIRFENIHPLEGGLVRRKYRRDRRPGLRLEKPVLFHLRYTAEMLIKYARFFWMTWQYRRILKRVVREARTSSYTDLAMTPVREDELERLDMYTATTAARAAVDRSQKRRRAGREVA